MEFIDGLGLAAGICTSSSLIPQLVTTLKKKKASEVSLIMFLVLFAGNSLWIYYGIEKKDIPIISTNIFSLLLNIAMLFLKFKYSKKPWKELFG
jgi:MtN3 and saliva related transmembrane protein